MGYTHYTLASDIHCVLWLSKLGKDFGIMKYRVPRPPASEIHDHTYLDPLSEISGSALSVRI